MADGLTNEQKKKISNERQNAVRNAWKEEKERVKNGQGTRNWTPEQQRELVERGAVTGFEGHHMKSVSLYPEYAGDPNNIQFLSENEHLNGAHQGNYHTVTNGYYDPENKMMYEFEGDGLKNVPVIHLSECNNEEYCLSIQRAREEYLSENNNYDASFDMEMENAASSYIDRFPQANMDDSECVAESTGRGHGMGR